MTLSKYEQSRLDSIERLKKKLNDKNLANYHAFFRKTLDQLAAPTHNARILNQAKRRKKSFENQEDLAQETWVQVLDKGQQDNAKYMTTVLKNTSIRMFAKEKIAERNASGVEFNFYSKDNSLKDAHLKKDIIKCYGYLNAKQKAILDVIVANPESEQKEWAEILGMERRNFTYHMLNIRDIFKSLLYKNELPGKSLGYLQDSRYDEVKRG